MKLFIFLKNCYFFKSAILSQKELVSSFEILNLEGNQKCTMIIPVSIWHIFKQMEKKIAKLLFSLNKTFRSSI